MLYGSLDIYKDGFVVHTTLDLRYQAAADKYMARGLAEANVEYRKTQDTRLEQAEKVYVPIVNALSLAFDLEDIHSSEQQVRERSQSRYVKRINPIVDAAALLFDLRDLKVMTNGAYASLKQVAERNTVEGAMVTLESETGYVKALVGGSKYDQSNQLIRATQGRIMPGSSFKPLYYSAAIDTRKFTPATLIYDSPVVFYNENGTPYIPLNFKGEWKGPVLLWYALAHSMNVPSLKVLDGIGFDAAIDRAALLLGIDNRETIRSTFPRVYPLGLGVASATPMQMARAYAVFANQGKEVTPIAIRSVEDRNGRVILDPEKELRLQQKRKGSDIQIISRQNAYVMTSLLEKTVESGTLAWASGWGSKFTYKDKDGNKYTIPAAGKTGTTQNWADAWTVGFTPYYSTAVWFGFDRPGNSLGVTQTGAIIAGPTWADYMREIHREHPLKDFVRPSTGLIDVEVCSKSGLLLTPNCNEGSITLTFLDGTQPIGYCDLHDRSAEKLNRSLDLMWQDSLVIDSKSLSESLKMPELKLDLQAAPPPSGNPGSEGSRPAFNPLLD
jgi:penicillin-binding protein 1A